MPNPTDPTTSVEPILTGLSGGRRQNISTRSTTGVSILTGLSGGRRQNCPLFAVLPGEGFCGGDGETVGRGPLTRHPIWPPTPPGEGPGPTSPPQFRRAEGHDVARPEVAPHRVVEPEGVMKLLTVRF